MTQDWPNMPEPSGNNHNPADISVDVLIVGAGFSGICMGIKLLEAGMKDFLVIERATTSAARGTKTVILAAPATFPRISILFRSNGILTGPACLPASRKSGNT